MRRRIAVVLVTVLATMTLAMGASANRLGPCNDGAGNVTTGATGADYAKHHITEFAKDGDLGNDGHKPGQNHQGFSACIPGITTGPR